MFHGLYACDDKYEFHKKEVKYLGYIINEEGIKMSEDKVKIIQEWSTPHNIKDIQSFCEFANSYQHFISNYSKITIPLTHLMKKGIPWNFNNKCLKAFKTLEKAFTTAPILLTMLPMQ